MLMPNDKDYDTKIPTNVRIEPDLKEKALEECETASTTLSDIINECLRERYKNTI